MWTYRKMLSQTLLLGSFVVGASFLQSACALPVRPYKHVQHAEIEKLEKEVRQALLSADTATLDKMLAEDFVGISSNGVLSDKQQYLRRIGTRQHNFRQLDISDTRIRLQRSSAIVNCLAHVVGTMDGSSIDGVYRYTRVYARQPAGDWKIVNFEATKVSDKNSIR